MTNLNTSNYSHIYLLIIILIAVLFFHLHHASLLYSNGLLTFDDGFFDSDIWTNHKALAHGWSRRTFAHPHLSTIFSVPIRLIDVVLYKIGLVSDRVVFREITALLICPVLSTLSGLIIYRLGYLYTNNSKTSLILAAFFLFSFTNIIFASIPESFAITNFLILVLLYYFALISNNLVKSSTFIWLILAISLTSVTVTSIAIFFIVYFTYNYKILAFNFFTSLQKSCVISIFSLSITLAGFYLTIYSLGYVEEASRGGITHYASFISISPKLILINLINTLNALTDSFIPFSNINFEPLNFCGQFKHCNAVYMSESRIDFTKLIAPAMITVIIYISYRHSIMMITEYRGMLFICILILIFNIFLHSFFGTEMFLFSSHWIASLCILLIPLIHRYQNIFITFVILEIIINIPTKYLLPSLVI